MDINNKLIGEKNNLVQWGRRIAREKLIVGTWGNLSVRVKSGEEEVVVITPSGMDYEKSDIQDLVVVDLEGNILEGVRKPSSELKMHLHIYKSRKDVNAIIHTHSTFATACAVSGNGIPMIVEDMVQHVGGNVRVAKYALPGTNELGENVVEALAGRKAVLLKNHGVAGVGEDLEVAYKSCVLSEKTAQIYIYASSLGKVSLISKEDADVMVDYYNNHYGQK